MLPDYNPRVQKKILDFSRVEDDEVATPQRVRYEAVSNSQLIYILTQPIDAN